MSLIEEALRRLQDPVITTTEQKSPAPQPTQRPRMIPPEPAHSWSATPSSNPSRAPRANRLLIGMAAAVLVLGTALCAVGISWSRQQRHASNLSPAALPAESVRTNRPAPLAPRESGKNRPITAPGPDEQSLIISGVVEGLGEPYVVINGAIVGIGESVGEFTLVAIGSGSVTLRRADGSEKILRLSR